MRFETTNKDGKMGAAFGDFQGVNCRQKLAPMIDFLVTPLLRVLLCLFRPIDGLIEMLGDLLFG